MKSLLPNSVRITGAVFFYLANKIERLKVTHKSSGALFVYISNFKNYGGKYKVKK